MSKSSGNKRVQFTIRTLFGLTTVTALIAATCGWWIHTSRLQQQAINSIASKGGYVWFDRAGSHIEIEFGVPQHEGCGQINLLAGPRIKEPTFSDDDMKTLSQIWRLRRVSFANTRVSSLAIERFHESNPGLKIVD